MIGAAYSDIIPYRKKRYKKTMKNFDIEANHESK